MPLDSKFYIVRPTDEEFLEAIARQDSIVADQGGRGRSARHLCSLADCNRRARRGPKWS